MNFLVLDLATAPIDGAEGFIEEPSAPANYRDELKIAEYIKAAKDKALAKAALDPDLGRISAIGMMKPEEADLGPVIWLCKDEAEERQALQLLVATVDASSQRYRGLIGYNSHVFDWPFLIRRAQYLGVSFPLDIDRYKSAHVDLMDRLTHHGKLTARSLGFYVRRLGWTDLHKTLSGAEEALAPSRGQWDELTESVEHDVIAACRLAQWMGVLPRDAKDVAA